MIHKTKRLCYDDHKGGGYGGEAGGNNAGLFFGIKAFLVYTVCNQQSHGVASHEGGNRIDGRTSRRLPDWSHNRFHKYTDKFHESVVNQEGQEYGPYRYKNRDRDYHFIKYERQHIRGVEAFRPPAEDGHSDDSDTDYFED